MIGADSAVAAESTRAADRVAVLPTAGDLLTIGISFPFGSGFCCCWGLTGGPAAAATPSDAHGQLAMNNEQ